MTDGRPVNRTVNVVLYLSVMLLAATAVVLGVQIAQDAGRSGASGAEGAPEQYAAVLSAAREEAEAFINIRYDDAEASIEKVASGATGEFRKQYDESTKGVRKVLRQNRSIMAGEVLWAGVVAADDDSATVIAATTGTVSNVQTENEPVARAFRLRLELVLEDGRWLTHDLQFVA
ncbi:hypothetical protein I601_3502 [Nocardioides dokdonensis FR1436]|uniref:Mce-associated membrane protein n=1 Tax=Nocardioides dokdonensis FR1436 TaxID=1300347 RepID=A0A1A9GNN8_9ACTN|nr:hypothetical protein [Nocardioides dokdonensis]ANH39908.1 hypothetical protein I601_3502 [Nocardioides dokdonensis FR1436]